MNLNSFDFDRLRIEIAILQEDVLAKNPGTAKFKIPVIITEDTISHIETSNSNIINRRNGNLSSSSINIENTIELKIPTEFTYFYGEEIVPAGTRFLVAFIGGNINDIKIISRYDSIDATIKEESKEEINNIFNNYNIPQLSFKVNLKISEINTSNSKEMYYNIDITGDLYSSLFRKLYHAPTLHTNNILDSSTYYVFYNINKKNYYIFNDKTIYSFANTYDYNNSIFIFSFDQYGYKNINYSSNHYFLNDIEIYNNTFYKDRAIVINGKICVNTNDSELSINIKNLECLDPTNMYNFVLEDKEILLPIKDNKTYQILFGIKRKLLNNDYNNKKFSSELVYNIDFPYSLQYDNLKPQYYNLYLFTIYNNKILYDLPYHKNIFFQDGKDIFD